MIWIFAVLAGILGRCGGAEGYNTKYRDLGVPAILCLSLGLVYGFSWWFFLIFLLTFASLTTYYDTLFNGEDNLWVSGLVCGISLFPILFIDWSWLMLTFVVARALLLMLIWGLLNKYMPKKLLFWRGDIANEFLRYFSVIATLAFLFL